MKKITKPKAKLPYKTGRNTKNTPDIRKKLLDALKVGHTDKDSYTLAGVGHDFFYSLIRKDTEFSEDVKKARLKAKDQCIKIIMSAASKTWTAAAWYLERRFKDEYSIKVNNQHDPITLNLSDQGRRAIDKYKKPKG